MCDHGQVGCRSISSFSKRGSTDFPFCSNGEVICSVGVPTCPDFLTPIPECGSNFGFTGDLSAPGCTNKTRTIFDTKNIVCTQPDRLLSSLNQTECNKKNLCPDRRNRIESCREDRTLCKCVCPFSLKNQKYTPRCNETNLPICSKDLLPICSNQNNTATCYEGKLFCQDTDTGLIYLTDKVYCQGIRKKD